MKVSFQTLVRYVCFFIISLISILGAVKIIFIQDVSNATTILTISSMVSLLILFFSDKVDWFDLRNMKVQLRDIRQTKEEVQKIAYNIVKLVYASQKGALFFDRPSAANQEMINASENILILSGIDKDDDLYKELIDKQK
jgi:hypothetical protein